MDPKTLRFTPTHEWIHADGGLVTVGISRFAVDQLTDLILIELPKVGSRVQQGKAFGLVESVKSVSDLYSPVTGEVVEVNQAAAAKVQLLSEDPYGKGWLVKIRVDSSEALPDLLDAEAYDKKVSEEAH